MSVPKHIHEDQRYLQALIDNDTQVIGEIYRRFSHRVKQFILQNNGSADDAADIFQEALVDVYNQARFKGLQLTCPFEPFLLLICKRKWLNELKKNGRKGVTIDIDERFNIGEDTFRQAELSWAEGEKAKLFRTMFAKLGKRCQEIIRSSLDNKPQEEVATALGVTYGYLRKKKSEMAMLIASINDNLSKWGLK
ncbi:RNA polymerase sigma factor [Chitinophaga horti]|uniref:RNA polymerase sigma factor n=1 Tax=Chitinophaga horti TaxID=2920382 RepID=A0ABY6IWX2_9BACT|nr:RNA polymerase sigma factor [Chitinophaga horti]UYQ91878.1 RNA polymerase sigma factor [Chitinophaga horti]